MRRTLLILSAALAMLISVRGQQPAGSRQPADGGGERRKVDFKADVMRSVPGMPDSVMRFLGNVVMHHNGTVLTCDSAYRFGDKHIECYGRVLINKDSTYIYGDQALYDGYMNVAEVYSPLVKVIDGEAVLYTRNFSFNTLDNIGRFWGGGTVEQKENRLESDRGYYYSDAREFVCVDNVEATDPQYKMMSDSVRYNMDTETAQFYTPTTIWNTKGEMLHATRGMYHNAESRYEFTRDAYILTAKQEVWSDSLDYNSVLEDAVLRRNIQIRDEEQKVMAFGDYGQYWGAREEGLLTRNPSMVTFDPEQDTLYMRSDSMWIYSIAYELDYREYDSLRRVAHGLLTADAEQTMLDGEGNPVAAPASDQALPDKIQELIEERRKTKLSQDEWGGEDDAQTREDMRWMVVESKKELYLRGDTLRREMLRPGFVDTLMTLGYSSEDIEGQIAYNERRRELEKEGRSVTDTLLYEVLESIGAFGDPVADPHEAALETLREVETAAQDAAEEEKAQAEEQKPLSRREQRRKEREREAAEKKDKQKEAKDKAAAAKTAGATGAGVVGPAAGTAGAAGSGKGGTTDPKTGITLPAAALESLVKIAANPELDSMVRSLVMDSTFRERGLSAMSDSLRTKLRDIGVDPQALGEQLISAGLTSNGLTLSGTGATAPDAALPDSLISLSDSLVKPAAPVKEPDSLQRVIFAYHNVRIFRVDMQAVCDSLVAFSKDSTAHLYIEPVLWNQQNQITAEVIDIFTQNQQLHRAFFKGWPMMVSEVDSTQYNQIKGREMESFFRDNKIFRHSVKGNAQTLYYMIDEPSGEANGFLVVNSASIAFLMEDQEIIRMTWYQDPDAVVYPIEKIPLDVDRFLEGFRWEAARRPALRDVFDRTIRPSEREHYESLRQPLFPITVNIDEQKKQLIESRRWEDRAETLEEITDTRSKEWLRSIGVDVTGR